MKLPMNKYVLNLLCLELENVHFASQWTHFNSSNFDFSSFPINTIIGINSFSIIYVRVIPLPAFHEIKYNRIYTYTHIHIGHSIRIWSELWAVFAIELIIPMNKDLKKIEEVFLFWSEIYYIHINLYMYWGRRKERNKEDRAR